MMAAHRLGCPTGPQLATAPCSVLTAAPAKMGVRTKDRGLSFCRPVFFRPEFRNGGTRTPRLAVRTARCATNYQSGPARVRIANTQCHCEDSLRTIQRNRAGDKIESRVPLATAALIHLDFSLATSPETNLAGTFTNACGNGGNAGKCFLSNVVLFI